MKTPRLTLTLATLTATLAMSAVGVAQAAQPGDLCRVAAGTGGGPVFSGTGVLLYVIPEGGYFRVEDYGPPVGAKPSYTGHGASQPTGNMWRWVIDQSSCV